MGKTTIEWATHTHNVLAGCSKSSPACQHCYAETMTARLAKMPQAPPRYHDRVIEGHRWTGRLSYDPDAMNGLAQLLTDPTKRVFLNSMSDTFHPHAPITQLSDLSDIIDDRQRKPTGVLMLLTKHPDVMLEWQRERHPSGLPPWVWVGSTVEDQQRANERLDDLLNVQAHVHYVSAEPLLGPLELDRWFDGFDGNTPNVIDWVIGGGESGPKARPTHPTWARDLRDQCVYAGVPFMWKQWGTWLPDDHAHILPDDVHAKILTGGGPKQAGVWSVPSSSASVRACCYAVGKHRSGRLLDGRTWDEIPQPRSWGAP